MEPKTLDLRGLKCPEPLKKTDEELNLIREGALTVLVDSPSNWNIERLAKKSGLRVDMKKHKDHYELKIIKTPHSKPHKEGIFSRILRSLKQEEPEEGMNDMMLVVTRDILGREEDIGKVLIKAFFETMKVMSDMPAAILFMNSGVKLTTIEDEIVELLRDFESHGVEIYSCSACLKHFKLEDRLRVGQAGGMAMLTEGMRIYKKIMTI